MKSTEIATLIIPILTEDLAPKRAQAVATKVGRALAKQLKEQPVAVSAPVELTPAAALKVLAKAIGAPRTRTAAAKSAKPAKSAKAAKPAAKAKTKRAKGSAAAKGKAKLSAKADNQNAAQKKVFWAVSRKVHGRKPRDTDAAILAAADKKKVREYTATCKAQRAKAQDPAVTKAPAAKATKPAATTPAPVVAATPAQAPAAVVAPAANGSADGSADLANSLGI